MEDTLAWFAGKQAIEVRTSHVLPDEPCYLLLETNRRSPSSKSVGRYQMLSVVREGRLVTAVRYLGPAVRFAQDPFQIPGGHVDEWGRGKVWHTVAELQDIAEELRSEQPRREQESTDLLSAYHDLKDEQRRRRRNQSTFGIGGHIQRDY